MIARLKLNSKARKWLHKNDACEEGYKWAAQNCATLAEVVETARPDWAVWTMTCPGVLTDRELWLLACWCAEQALPAWYAFAPDDHRPRQAIEARRGWLDGSVSDDDLSAAAEAARLAESAAEAARLAESAAAWSAAWSAARLAAARSARSAWSALARSAESDAESAQRDWLLANTSPTFADGSQIGGAK